MSRKLNPKWDVVVQKVAAVVHPVDKVHLHQAVMTDSRLAATHRQSLGSQHLARFQNCARTRCIYGTVGILMPRRKST